MTGRRLDEFAHDKKREGCLVCLLPDTIRAQLGPAGKRRGFPRDLQLEWLHTEVGAAHPEAREITMEVLAAHVNGQHDKEVA